MTKSQLSAKAIRLSTKLQNKIAVVENQLHKLHMINYEAKIWLMNHEVETGMFNAALIKDQQKAMEEMYKRNGLTRLEECIG